MTCKTILLHLSEEKNADQLLEAACNTARRFEAHLIGLYVMPSFIPPAALEVAYSGELLEISRNAQKEIAARLKKKFEAAIANQSFVGEWRLGDATGSSTGDVICEQARTADLTILQQAGDEDSYGLAEIIEKTAFDSGRPILVVPTRGHFPKLGSDVLIAWNASRESARAVFDALPFLKAADKVHIVTVDPQDVQPSSDFPGSELAATLARHGVNCETEKTFTGDIRVGDVILNYTADNGINLIVMGCYGHSRLREFVFGGATKNILQHMTAPVLMSH